MLRLMLLLAGLGDLLALGAGKAAETLLTLVGAEEGFPFPLEEYLLQSQGGPRSATVSPGAGKPGLGGGGGVGMGK